MVRTQEITETNLSKAVVDLLIETGLAKSRSEAKRQLSEGSVKLDGVKLTGLEASISPVNGSVIQVGKRRWVKIVNADTSP